MTAAALLTGYFLVWPIVSAGVLVVLIVALLRDMRNARRDGEEMI
jgi:hypothetical protein